MYAGHMDEIFLFICEKMILHIFSFRGFVVYEIPWNDYVKVIFVEMERFLVEQEVGVTL